MAQEARVCAPRCAWLAYLALVLWGVWGGRVFCRCAGATGVACVDVGRCEGLKVG